ncbi:MAG: right-handed parallel beta-helix repeat-containing protein, partial [Candidatus Woesearchaeota archaeon]|nr:right-handed parallel beta-helix repeat-containing protein [Candidatus Woesearchaeota archaeon]
MKKRGNRYHILIPVGLIVVFLASALAVIAEYQVPAGQCGVERMLVGTRVTPGTVIILFGDGTRTCQYPRDIPHPSDIVDTNCAYVVKAGGKKFSCYQEVRERVRTGFPIHNAYCGDCPLCSEPRYECEGMNGEITCCNEAAPYCLNSAEPNSPPSCARCPMYPDPTGSDPMSGPQEKPGIACGNSGCCDPYNERCYQGTCAPKCMQGDPMAGMPAEIECGANCCESDQTCRNGKCINPNWCEKREQTKCGETCCEWDEECNNGECEELGCASGRKHRSNSYHCFDAHRQGIYNPFALDEACDAKRNPKRFFMSGRADYYNRVCCTERSSMCCQEGYTESICAELGWMDPSDPFLKLPKANDPPHLQWSPIMGGSQYASCAGHLVNLMDLRARCFPVYTGSWVAIMHSQGERRMTTDTQGNKRSAVSCCVKYPEPEEVPFECPPDPFTFLPTAKCGEFNCCMEGEKCENGECVVPFECPIDPMTNVKMAKCGEDNCCMAGDTCENGQCVPPGDRDRDGAPPGPPRCPPDPYTGKQLACGGTGPCEGKDLLGRSQHVCGAGCCASGQKCLEEGCTKTKQEVTTTIALGSSYTTGDFRVLFESVDAQYANFRVFKQDEDKGRLRVAKTPPAEGSKAGVGISLLKLEEGSAPQSTPSTVSNAVTGCQTLSKQNTVYTLTQDVVADKGCFVAKGQGSTLDCGGHTIRGSGQGAGVRIETFMGGFTVKNCKITEFQTGIEVVTHTRGVVLENNELFKNTENGVNSGVHNWDVQLTNNNAYDNGKNGFQFNDNSYRALVTNNRATNNGGGGFVWLHNSYDPVFKNNQASGHPCDYRFASTVAKFGRTVIFQNNIGKTCGLPGAPTPTPLPSKTVCTAEQLKITHVAIGVRDYYRKSPIEGVTVYVSHKGKGYTVTSKRNGDAVVDLGIPTWCGMVQGTLKYLVQIQHYGYANFRQTYNRAGVSALLRLDDDRMF